jgi:hypothetical protein
MLQKGFFGSRRLRHSSPYRQLQASSRNDKSTNIN